MYEISITFTYRPNWSLSALTYSFTRSDYVNMRI